MDEDFINFAYKIRKNITKTHNETELLKQKKRSRYNKNLYLTKCALCDENVEDVHHITPQELSNDKGVIDHFHKNHKYNLIPLCKKHHKKVHEGKIIINGFVMTEEGLKLHYDERE